MARVNIEEHAFGEARINRLAREMGWDERQALGALVYLWHDSQEHLRICATGEEIADWSRAKSGVEADSLVRALQAAKYITSKGDGTFEIHGNEAQIDHRLTAISRARKGGAANRKRWLAEKAKRKRIVKPQLEAKLASTPSYLTAVLQDSPMQCNAVQGNAVQSKATHSSLRATSVEAGRDESEDTQLIPFETEPVKPKKLPKGKAPAKTTAAWESYSEEYRARWKVEPVRNAKINKNLSDLIDRLGAREAPEVLRHYVWSNDQFYVRKRHPVGLCLQDAESLRTEWMSGERMTATAAKQADRASATDDAFEAAFAAIERKETRADTSIS